MKTEKDKIKDRDEAIQETREIIKQPYYILDTETTGLNNAQMCQIAIQYSNGESYKSLIKPTVPIELGAMNVHHITNEMTENAPTAAEIAIDLPGNRVMVIYNAPFDTKIIKQSMLACGKTDFSFGDIIIYDAMQIYSKFRGEWNDYYQNYKWHKLEVACNQCGIKIDVELHDALSDCIMTDRLIHYIAEQKLSIEI